MSRKKEQPQEAKEININDTVLLEQTMQYEKKIYDLEQLIDIAKSFCSTLDFGKLLESIVYISMAQMHVLGAEIFVKNLTTNENLELVTSSEKLTIPVNCSLSNKLLDINGPVTFQELSKLKKKVSHLDVLEKLNPTLIVPLIQKNHLNGIIVLQERITIGDDDSYTDYDKSQIMSIASLASVAINNAALLEMSSTDMMTHLKLKYFFYNILTEAIDSAFVQTENLSVLMFDIDFFKKFNDTYGHECGDFVLIQVAELIKQSLRESDVASRYGGEEFTVLLNKTGKEEALLVAERIRQTIADHDFVFNEKHLHVTISVGVTVFDANTNLTYSPNELVNQADKALYISKNTGRNKVTWYDPKNN
ncbi:MAG: sensor domain-containing diguanylate cyclase [Treponema sp.]|nr:sensor domain-containing diguanylate cyclase [Treponema sp.]